MDKNANDEEYAIEDDLFKDEIAPKGRLELFLYSKYYIMSILVLVAAISFSLGRISVNEIQKMPVRVLSGTQGEVMGASTAENQTRVGLSNESPTTATPLEQSSSEKVVGSKNGTKYHYLNCPGAKQISAKNLITFNSIEEARAKGYTPASNCKGLK